MNYIQKQQELIKANISGAITTSKKVCSANIIFNGKGEILLLKRSANDSFHPNFWCLPGGGVDYGELPIDGCKRETYEESGIESDSYQIINHYLVSLPKVNIHYYISVLEEFVDPFVVVDEAEHCQYQWCTVKQWMAKDLILDLKKHLVKILKTQFT